MNETFTNELKKWKINYLKAQAKFLKKYPLNDTLNNNHSINKLQKEFWQKKIKIYQKYNKL